MLQVIDEARDRLNALGREAARRADDGAQFALERARTQRASWTIVAGALGLGFVTAFALLNTKKAAVATTSAMSGDWLDVLTTEQRRIERIFQQIEATGEGQATRRGRLLDGLNAALTKHALQKENVIYPALRGTDHGASSTPLAAELFEIKTYLFELDALPTDDVRWTRKVQALHHLFEEHIAAEAAVFPSFQEALSAQENARLTRNMNREALKLA